MSTDCVTVKVAPWFVLIGAFRSSLRLLLIGGFQSLSFRLEIVPSAGLVPIGCCVVGLSFAVWVESTLWKT